MNGDITPSPPPPADVGATSSSGGRKVAFDESPNAGFVMGGKKDVRGRKTNRGKRRNENGVSGPAAAATPATIPAVVPASSSPPTGAVMYSQVAAPPLLRCHT